ncbi:MAG: VIT domain-containing protein [Blastocatellia bacterium]
MAHTEEPIADNSGKTAGDYSKLEFPDTPLQRLLNQPDYNPPNVVASIADNTGELFFNTFATKRKRAGGPFFFFGVAIPASAIFLELLAGVCANMFFDPIPTIWHKLLVCMVPLANFAIWWELKNDDAEYSPRLAAASGLAIGVSAFYALLFVPLIPFAAIGIIVLGIGILGLSPQLSFGTSVRGAIQLRRLNRAQSEQTPTRFSFATCLVGGVILSLGTLAALEARTTLTRINLQRAASTDSATSTNGVRWLRSYAAENTLLEACYWRPTRATDLFGTLLTLGNPVTPAQAQTVFYRVTGKSHLSLPKPQITSEEGFFRLDLGTDRGLGPVNGLMKGLSLSSSRIDGLIDADAALGYFEWTMIFQNNSTAQQEARAQIQLPPGGVVSRLTLWVNGEPREAAFASRGKVEAAYQAVVSARRDPVLVTSSGDDRVLVQCFPVLPNGEMKIRFGVTAPVTLESKARGWLRLPTIIERNFGVEGLNHAVWFESKSELLSPSGALMAERPEQRLFAVRGALTDNELISTHQSVNIERSAEASEFWASDPNSKASDTVRQTIEERDWQRPQRVVLVVDASQNMQPHLTAIADSVQRLPEAIELIALAAGDEIAEFKGAVADKIRRIKPVGGNDNLPALNRAWDLAAQQPGSAILWIHESKPVLIGNADELRQRWERRPGSPQMFDLPVLGGANRVAEKLDGIEAIETVERSGNLENDLDRLFARWRGQSKQIVIHREKAENRQQEQRKDLQQTSSHLARLWAFDETRRLIAAKQTDAAVKLAATYQLVTPVSGAVVLETAEQYQRAGLEPVPPNSVPTIPEPEEWLLMFVALAVLLWMTCRRRFAWRSA